MGGASERGGGGHLQHICGLLESRNLYRRDLRSGPSDIFVFMHTVLALGQREQSCMHLALGVGQR